MSFECPNCGCPATSSSMTPTGVVKKCRDCGLILGSAPRPNDPDNGPPTRGQSVTAAAFRAPQTAATKTEPATKVAPVTPATVLRCTRKRVTELKREIAREEKQLARNKREFAELSRLLDAAKAQPRAVVRPIRTTA